MSQNAARPENSARSTQEVHGKRVGGGRCGRTCPMSVGGEVARLQVDADAHGLPGRERPRGRPRCVLRSGHWQQMKPTGLCFDYWAGLAGAPQQWAPIVPLALVAPPTRKLCRTRCFADYQAIYLCTNLHPPLPNKPPRESVSNGRHGRHAPFGVRRPTPSRAGALAATRRHVLSRSVQAAGALRRRPLSHWAQSGEQTTPPRSPLRWMQPLLPAGTTLRRAWVGDEGGVRRRRATARGWRG